MLVFKKVADLQKHLAKLRNTHKTIGFAPTMGALHQGHISLVQASKQQCDITVVSIFVNPTQFNLASDLAKYPRTPEADIELVADAQCDILFMPSIAEIYPDGTTPSVSFDFGDLDKVLEGAFRPGHFGGMAQVVYRLLEIVAPDALYMGQKDFQQATIVASLIAQKALATELVVCPIIREADGLAMSSRNVRLNADERAAAVRISKALFEIKDLYTEGGATPKEICEKIQESWANEPLFKLEYITIVDGNTLQPVSDFETSEYIVALAAVWVGDVRLIDNIILKKIENADTIEDNE